MDIASRILMTKYPVSSCQTLRVSDVVCAILLVKIDYKDELPYIVKNRLLKDISHILSCTMIWQSEKQFSKKCHDEIKNNYLCVVSFCRQLLSTMSINF